MAWNINRRMAGTKSWNPLAFLPTQVSLIGSAVYIALFAIIIWIHESVPSAPSNPTPVPGFNLTQAWFDLDFITDGYHPWSSRRNDDVRKYLLTRIDEILRFNGVGYRTVYARPDGSFVSDTATPQPVTVFANDTANFTSRDDWTNSPLSMYGESLNLYVYIRGDADGEGEWWNSTRPYDGPSGVLVNAHYDSVSSGFGATDDGIGVVTVLQLISHFTRDGGRARPRRGLVAMLNNGEEDGLFGARSYVRHPLAQFPHTFLNLEGAGAGGRAMLFRATDAEVIDAYGRSPHPFGTVITDDGFKRGLVRSGTDFTIFTDRLGLRGLDLAFFRPRARYHTEQDDSRDAGINSLWHMLSSSAATVEALTSYRGDEFEASWDEAGRLGSSAGSGAVWFDMFGLAFAILRTTTQFALSVTLLVLGPLIFILLDIYLRRADKWYPFAGKQYLRSADDDDSVDLRGRRGFFRFLIAFVIATGVVFALAYLQAKINPYLIYSSEYAVWTMMLSAWFAVAWFSLAGASNVRPTALQRMFALIWLYVISWILLVAATVAEKNFQVGGGYFALIYNATSFVALLISYLELFALPTRTKFVESVFEAQTDDNLADSGHRGRSSGQSGNRRRTNNDESEPTERTSLLQDGDGLPNQTFTGIIRRLPGGEDAPESAGGSSPKVFDSEQAWSSTLPQWTWIVQFLVLAPINIIIVGQIALISTSTLNQTIADGNSALTIYLFIALLTVLLLLPLTPFLHRFSYRVATFLLLVFIGCLIYNMMAFPFSRDSRMKYFFAQQVDLDTGDNTVLLTGLDSHLQKIIDEIPSASGRPLDCHNALGSRRGLRTCRWHGLSPNVVPENYLAADPASGGVSSNITVHDWVRYNISHTRNSAVFTIRGLNTKTCVIQFDQPVSDFQVDGGASDARMHPVGANGSKTVLLLSRTWDKVFTANVTWPEGFSAKGQTGRLGCMWADANQRGTIPAFDELRRFQPVWSAMTKISYGLVDGLKKFEI